jgi:hypothetical protein
VTAVLSTAAAHSSESSNLSLVVLSSSLFFCKMAPSQKYIPEPVVTENLLCMYFRK